MINNGIDDTDALSLKRVSEAGKPPKERLSTARDAYTIAEKLIQANDGRRTVYAAIQGMFDGNPPWKTSALRNAGMAWCANFNTMEGKALRSQAATPFYDLFTSTKRPIDVQTAFGAAEANEDRAIWSQIISEGLRNLIRKYQPWHSQFWGMICDMVSFNKGFIMWNGPKTFDFRWVPQHLVEVPDDTPCNLDELEVLQIRRNITVSELWMMAKGKPNWDQELLIQSIRDATGEKTQPWDAVEVQRSMNENDLSVSSSASKVELIELFVRELDSGRLYSHYAIDRKMIEKEDRDRDDRFLFRLPRAYESAQEFIVPYFYEVANGGWNASAGLGKDIFSIMRTNDRLACKEFDGAFMRLSIILQAMTAEAINKAGLVNVGNVTIIPPGFAIQQSTLIGDISTAISVRQDLRNIVSGNTGIFRPSLDKPSGNPITAQEASLRFQQATTLNASGVDRFYDQHDVFCAEFYRRVLLTAKDGTGKCKKLSKEFMEYCRIRGVPREALEEMEYVASMRSVGSGSSFIRQQSYLGVGQNFLPMMPEDGRMNYLQDTAAILTDQFHADRWFPSAAKRRMPSDDEAFATLENAAIRVGSPAVRTPRQNDVVHAQVHLLAGVQAVESLSTGADPATVFQFINGIGSHTVAHLEPMRQDPTRKQVYAELKEQWDGLAKVADGIKDELDRQAAQQQEAEQIRAQAEAVQSGVDPQIQLKAATQQKQLELKEQKTRHGMMLNQQQAEQKMALADASTAADIRRKNAKSTTEGNE